MKCPSLASTLFLALVLHSAVGHGEPQPPDSGPLPDMQVNSRANPCVRLRSSGSIDRNVVDCLEVGTRLRLLGSISGWSHVRLLDGTEGWVASGYLEAAPASPAVEGAAAPQPLAEPPSDLQGKIEALEGQLEAISSRRKGTAERLRKTVAAAEAAQREASQLRQRVQQLESDTRPGGRPKELEAQLAAERARVTELEKALAEAEKALRTAEQASAQQASRIARLETDLPAAQGREAELRQALAAAEARVATAEQRQAEQAQRIESLTGELADAERKTAEAMLKSRLAGQPEPATERPAESRVKVRAPIVSAPEPAKVSVRMPAAVSEKKATPPPELPAEPSIPATDAAINAIRAWAAAWSDQRVDDYLSFYAPGFQPPDGLGRGEWEAQRRQRLSRPRFIRVTISGLSAELADDGTVTATFQQDYESDSFSDTVTKVMTLAEEDGAWRMLVEQATP